MKINPLGILLLLAVFFQLPLSVYATPNVTSAAPVTTFSHNAVVNIGGTAFGSKAQAAPLLWNPMDGEAAYAGYTNGQPLPPVIGPWGLRTD
jgi:hypothetical protein